MRTFLFIALCLFGSVTLASDTPRPIIPGAYAREINDAFTIPLNVRFDAKQQKAYDKMRVEYEPKLINALQYAHKSIGTGKVRANREVEQLKSQIKQEISKITNTSPVQKRYWWRRHWL